MTQRKEYERQDKPLQVMGSWGWWDNARCRGVTIGDMAFEEVKAKKDVARARAVCAQCPVQRMCLEEALALEAPLGRSFRFGFRAGLTEKERYRLGREVAA